MPALPALLLSIYVVVPLLTMAPRSLSQPSSLAALRMGEYGHMTHKPRPLSLTLVTSTPHCEDAQTPEEMANDV